MSYHHAPIIGYHRAPLSQKFGAPRQPNLVALISIIEMMPPYDAPAAFEGLEAFSHIWLSWQFHHNYLNKEGHVNKESLLNKNSVIDKDNDSNNNKVERLFIPQVRPPRLGGNQKVGVFASRSMYRPSGLGLSVVKLEKMQVLDGKVLLMISGADMIDGTPIIDIKPYVAYSDAIIEAHSGFASAAPELSKVTITQSAYAQFMTLIDKDQPEQAHNKNNAANSGMENAVKNTATLEAISEVTSGASIIHKVQKQLLASDIEHIKDLIAQDPRPAYRRDELNTTFIMRYKSIDVSFQQIEKGHLQITAVVEVL